MKRKGYTIDAVKIAAGLIEIMHAMGENYTAALRFGMLPGPLMELLEKDLERKAGEIFPHACQEQERKDFSEDCTREIVSEMYAQGELVV